MGALMAGRLVDAGYDVTVWNRTAGRAEPLAAAGAAVAETPYAAATGRHLVITMLADPPAVADVLFGADGAAAALGPGSVAVEMSTIGPAEVARLRERLPAGTAFVDAPVRGSLPQARAGELEIYAGGTDRDVAACREPLAALGRVHHVGPAGSGAALKLVVNTVTVPSFVLLGEVLTIADRLGVDTRAALDAVADIMPLAGRVRARLADPQPPTQFALALAEKDLALVLGEPGDPEPQPALVAAARAYLAAASAAGLGERDVTAVIDHLRGRSA